MFSLCLSVPYETFTICFLSGNLNSYIRLNGTVKGRVILELFLGDNLNLLKKLSDNSIDSIVTDPPYGLSFMNKKWDHSVPSVEFWKECFRVLKPGGHVLSFGGTRTYHRMAVNIEDAGFEIRDQIQWIYGSGFPKSHNISKGIDKKFGVVSELGEKNPAYRPKQLEHNSKWETAMRPEFKTVATSDQAKKWDGFGTALKPANEPIVLARKPLSEKTIVDNVLKWGTGALNIDGCRVETKDNLNSGAYSDNREKSTNDVYGEFNRLGPDKFQQPQGRWPANIILDEQAAEMFPITKTNAGGKSTHGGVFGSGKKTNTICAAKSEVGLASRFFYCAKASKKERNAGLTDITNGHPTIKPIKLMEYLIKLITPPNGVVLDPFMGSGSTGVAARNLGFDFVGMELDQEYFEIAKGRIIL